MRDYNQTAVLSMSEDEGQILVRQPSPHDFIRTLIYIPR
jgi:hypothetical protein